MADDPFLDEDVRVLTPEAFDFVLNNELKRAVRSQNYLTLLVLEPTPRVPDQPRDSVIRDVARLVSREVRETDLLARTDEGQLSVVLLDSDVHNSMHVVDRLVSRFEHYEFPTPVAIEVGAATCPTHGADAQTLRRAAEAQPIHPRRDDRGNASNAQ
jgi:PleD family two-component response regulator